MCSKKKGFSIISDSTSPNIYICRISQHTFCAYRYSMNILSKIPSHMNVFNKRPICEGILFFFTEFKKLLFMSFPIKMRKVLTASDGIQKKNIKTLSLYTPK